MNCETCRNWVTESPCVICRDDGRDASLVCVVEHPQDIVAIERATLDLIRTEDLIPGAMPKDFELGSTGHLFERIHRKDPYAIAEELETLGHGSRSYELLNIE